MASKTASKAEGAVREYLQYVMDPSSYEGPDLSDIETQIQNESDPIAKARLMSERDRMKDVGPRLEKDFTDNLKPFLEANPDIKPESLIELGVDRGVMARGGYPIGRTYDKSKPDGGKRTRRTKVSSESIANHIVGLRKGTTFTVAQISNDAGGSPATISKVIKDLETDGKVTDNGKDPYWSGRGRAPTLFKRA